MGQHPGITRIPPPLGTVAPVKPRVFPTWGTCTAGDQLCMIASTWGTVPELMGETLRDLPAGLVPSPFFAHIFSMHRTVRMPESGVGQGPEPHFFWSNVHLCGWRWVGQVECSATKPVIISARPMPPAVPRAPWASSPAIPVAGSGLAPFRHFFFGPLGGTCAHCH